MEWNFILLSGEDVDFFGWRVLAIARLFDGDIDDSDFGDSEEDLACDVDGPAVAPPEAAFEVMFMRDGGVVLNCNQSRYM